jgi:hypothetical protein
MEYRGPAPTNTDDVATKSYVDTGDGKAVAQDSSGTVKIATVLTAAAYAALGTKVATTLYVIVG